MSLADDLLAPVRTTNRGAICGVELFLAEIAKTDPDAADAFVQVLGDGRYPATVISARLKAAGWGLPAQVIQRHRREECKCPR